MAGGDLHCSYDVDNKDEDMEDFDDVGGCSDDDDVVGTNDNGNCSDGDDGVAAGLHGDGGAEPQGGAEVPCGHRGQGGKVHRQQAVDRIHRGQHSSSS